MRIQWKLAWRETRVHPGRALLTALSVVAGVAAVLAVGLSTGTARRAYQEMFRAVTGRADLEITVPGAQPIDDQLLPVVRQTPGVQAAVPLIQRNAILYYGDGRMKTVAMGIDPALDAAVRDYQLVAGKTLAEQSGVWLDASLAETLGVQPGDRVKLLVRRGLVGTTVVGLIRPRSGAAIAGGGVLLLPLTAAQYLFEAPGQLDRIQVVLAPGADREEVRSELLRRLPEGVMVEPPTTHSALAEETMLALENGLRLATAFSLLAAVFIITNTFSMNVGQRRRRLAVMRAIGATRRQMGGLIYREALVLGVVGTLVGMGLGWVGARVLNGAVSMLYQTPLPPLELHPLPVVLAVVFGLASSLVGAWLPARKASSISPLEGMSGVAREDTESPSRKGLWAGVAVLLLAIGTLVAVYAGRLPITGSVPATVVLLVGLVLLLPLGLQPLTGWVERLMRPVWGVEVRLARRQLLRHRGRTTLTIGVLFIAVSTGLGLASAVLDNVHDVRQWYRTTIGGDFFVRASMPDLETGLSAAVPEVVGDELDQVDGVLGIKKVRFVSATVNGEPAIVIAVGDKHPVPGTGQEPITAFSPPSGRRVVVGSVLAWRLKIKAGDTITLETPQGPQQLPVAQVANDYAAGGLTVHMSWKLAEQLLGIEGVDAYVVKAERGKIGEVQAQLREIARRHGMLLQSYSDLTAEIESMMSGVVGSLWGLLTLGLIVASFGVVNTLGMNVLEQTRELGLLRVIAMTRRQVRRTVVAQAAMMGLLAVLPGLAAGVLMAYVIHLTTLPVIGHPVGFTVRPDLLVAAFFAAMAMVLAAAWIPGQRAARLQPTLAVRYE